MKIQLQPHKDFNPIVGLKECWEVELRKLMSNLPKARLFLLIASDLLDVQSRLLLFCGVAWRFGKKKVSSPPRKKKKSNHWTPSKLGIYPSPLSHLSVQKVWCSELLPTQCSFIAESTQIQCWSDGLRQNCYVQLHSNDLTHVLLS